MLNVRALREERDKLRMDTEAILEKAEAENRGLSSEEDVEWQQKIDHIDALDDRIKRAERQNELSEPPPVSERDLMPQASDSLPGGSSPEQDRLKFIRWILGNGSGSYVLGDAFMTDKVRSSYDSPVLGTGRWGRLEQRQRAYLATDVIDEMEARALGINVGETGGYLVDTSMAMELDEAMKQYGRIFMTGARMYPTATGNPITFPLNDDTANEAYIVGEGEDSEEEDLTFGNATLRSYRYSTGSIRVSLEQLQDSNFDVESLIFKSFGTRLGRGMGRHATTGTGSGQPQGIATGATQGVSLASAATSPDYDSVVDLEESIDPAYQEMGEYAFPQSIRALLRKVKDSDGIPLFRFMDTPDGPVNIFNNKRYTIINEMAGFGQNNRFMLFGDFSHFIIRQSMGLQVYRQMETHITRGQIGLVGFGRCDSRMVDASGGAIKYMTRA